MNAQTARRVEGPRLVYYRSQPDAAFWDAHWHSFHPSEVYQIAVQGYLGCFEEPFTHYLPRHGRIIEAGCGLAQHVLALRVRGYDAEGVEWGDATTKAVQAQFPDLPVRQGDVTQLNVPDATCHGYISLGVIEHLQAGPEPFLREAYRVLAPGGVACIAVPYFHPLRRLKAHLGMYQEHPDGLQFYQYAFTPTELAALLRSHGFHVIDRMAYDSYKGIKDETPVVRRMFTWPGIGRRWQQWLQQQRYLDAYLGHMILMVCQKPDR